MSKGAAFVNPRVQLPSSVRLMPFNGLCAGKNHQKQVGKAPRIMIGNLQVNCPCYAGNPSGKCRLKLPARIQLRGKNLRRPQRLPSDIP